MFKKLLILSLGVAAGWLLPIVHAASTLDYGLQQDMVGSKSTDTSMVWWFANYFWDIFFVPSGGGTDVIMTAFIAIAFNIKNLFIVLAVIFLIYGVIRLLLASGSEDDLKRWRVQITWVTIGIFFMQISFSIWSALMGANQGIGSPLAVKFWIQIFSPLVSLLQILASFAFLAMMIFAFYRVVWSGGDEELAKRWRRILIYALLGFILIQLPSTVVGLIYGDISGCRSGVFSTCNLSSPNLPGVVQVFGTILSWINTFLTIACVILVIYTGVMVLLSWGDEEKLKKARNNIIYIAIGLLILFASQAIFRFFIMDAPI